MDTLDTDDDADSMPDVSDAFPQDTDNDGVPNSTDMDDDGDGLSDVIDANPLVAQVLNVDGIYKGSTINDQQSVQ